MKLCMYCQDYLSYLIITNLNSMSIDPQFIFYNAEKTIAIPARFKLPQKQVAPIQQEKPAEQKPKEEPKQDNEIEKIISEIKARL